MIGEGSTAGERTVGDFDGNWDAAAMRRFIGVLRPLMKGWFRSEVRNIERFPTGGSLAVSNHSGGLLPMDLPVLAVDFFDAFGFDRPLYTLGHDVLFVGPMRAVSERAGLIRATRSNAARALKSGAVVMVFPGGDYDAYRPSRAANKVDFGHRVGYVKTAVKAGVPIVPVVSIGGQENQLYLSRGEWLAKRLGAKKFLRTGVLPITFGVPFGFSVLLPVNIPLPTKIITEVLDPIDVTAEFGDEPDIVAVDARVRRVMQSALDRLAAERRRPVLG